MENYGLAYLLTILTDTASHEVLTNYIINLDTNNEIDRKIKYELFSKNETFFSKWSKKINGKEWVKILKSFNTLNEEEENIKTSLFYDDYIVDVLIKDLKCNDWMELINSLDFTKSSDQEIIICLYDNQKIFDRLLDLLTGSDWMKIILRFDTKSELFSRLNNILINNDEKEKIINELKPETARALLYLLGYDISRTNVPNMWNVIDKDESGVKHIVGNITYDGNEYHLIIDSDNVSYNSDDANKNSFIIMNSNHQPYQLVSLEENDLFVISNHVTYKLGDISLSIHDYSLHLCFTAGTDDNMPEKVEIVYNILAKSFHMETSRVMCYNKNGVRYQLVKNEHGLLVEKTVKLENGYAVDESSHIIDGTLVEVVASNKEVIGYVSDFFDLLREKVFPFFKGDIVSYLISNDTLNRFFPNGELASKLVRKRKISD